MIVVRDNRGQGIALVIILTAFIFLMGSAAVALSTSLRRNAGLEIRQKKAYYIAEAGIKKAIFLVRSGQLPLEYLDSGGEVNLVPDHIPSDYASGLIDHVKVSRESGKESEIIIFIESLGIYKGARCTLQTRIKVAMSLDFEMGLWISSSIEKPSLISPGSRILSQLYTSGPLSFSGNTVNGDLYTGDDLVLVGDTYLTGDIKGCENFKAGPNCRVDGNVLVKGGVEVDDDASIEGDIRAAGDVIVHKAYIGGSIWSNGEILVDQAGGQVEGGIYPGQSMELSVALPSFPEVDLSYFHRGADKVFKGLQVCQGSLKLDGLTFIDGDLEIAGDYRGKGIIVVDGAVSITGDLLTVGAEDSLCILATGPVTIDSEASAAFLVYGQENVTLDEGATVQGSIITPTLQMRKNAEFIYQDSLVSKFPPSSFVILDILSWKKGS